jgi:serine/threonine protein kinase
MGVVYEAEATRLGGRPCAVKVLLPEFVARAAPRARFAREAEVAARVKHPNVVEIFDTGTAASGLGYIAMELLTGEGLDRTLRRGPLPWPRAQHITPADLSRPRGRPRQPRSCTAT